MKIAIVCPNDFTIVTFCGALVSLLQDDNRNEVYAVCDVHDESPRGYYTDIMTSWGVYHVPLDYYRFVSVPKDIRYLLALYRIMARERFDIVINIATKANVYGSITAKLAGTRKIVCAVWGLGMAFAADGRGSTKVLRRIVLCLYRIGFWLSDRIWFTNKADYEWFVSTGVASAGKAFLTKNYVNTAVYSPDSVTRVQIDALREEFGLKDRENVVVMVGRMSWAKGVREFVEAATMLRNEMPATKFILVGPSDEGSSDSVPESFLRECEKSGNFVWAGFRKEVQVFYAASDVAVLPSYYREGGFPRGLTEAMSMGKPIITTNSVHCRGTVEHGKNGYHVPMKDSKALAMAIKKIITDEDRKREFGMYSRLKVMNEFDEMEVVSQVVREIL